MTLNSSDYIKEYMKKEREMERATIREQVEKIRRDNPYGPTKTKDGWVWHPESIGFDEACLKILEELGK